MADVVGKQDFGIGAGIATGAAIGAIGDYLSSSSGGGHYGTDWAGLAGYEMSFLDQRASQLIRAGLNPLQAYSIVGGGSPATPPQVMNSGGDNRVENALGGALSKMGQDMSRMVFEGQLRKMDAEVGYLYRWNPVALLMNAPS